MRKPTRTWFVAAVMLILSSITVYLSFGGLDFELREYATETSAADILYASVVQTSTFRVIPESIMIGLCWRSADGAEEGLFKDINQGISHWRDQAPDASDGDAAAVESTRTATPATSADYAMLSQLLEQLSFQAADYVFTEQSAGIEGFVQFVHRRRPVILNFNNTVTSLHADRQDVIELHASAAITDDVSHEFRRSAQHSQAKLCISMQAAASSVFPDPFSGKPLMLSRYY